MLKNWFVEKSQKFRSPNPDFFENWLKKQLKKLPFLLRLSYWWNEIELKIKLCGIKDRFTLWYQNISCHLPKLKNTDHTNYRAIIRSVFNDDTTAFESYREDNF